MLFIVNLRPLPKIKAWGGVVNTLFGIITPVTCPQSRVHQIYDPSPRVPFSIDRPILPQIYNRSLKCLFL